MSKLLFFILGWVAEKYPTIVQKIADEGHDVGCHSHAHQLVYKQSPIDFERDLQTALQKIERACGVRPVSYRAPGFSVRSDSLWAISVLDNNGILFDSSIFPAPRAHGGISDLNVNEPFLFETNNGSYVKEFPLNYNRIFTRKFVFTGGGYFRLTPQWLLNRVFNKTKYTMTYFHPRDFDFDQPMIPNLSHTRKFKSYVGIRKCMSKLENISKVTKFVSLSEADSHINWRNAHKIEIQ